MICAESRYNSLIGRSYSYLTLVRILQKRVGSRVVGEFRCVCGSTLEHPISRVKSGYRKHCGCKANHAPRRTHGMRYTPEYRAWSGMKGRCADPNNKDYARWGGKGVRAHPGWMMSFEAFYAHIGPRPNRATLDRIDTTGDYVPGNVRWASATVQAENRRNSWFVDICEKTYESVEAAARAHGVTATTVVRWCDGCHDARRGKTRPPKVGCYRRRKYG